MNMDFAKSWQKYKAIQFFQFWINYLNKFLQVKKLFDTSPRAR